jgi:hypothetical protein
MGKYAGGRIIGGYKGDVEGGIYPWDLFLWPQYSDGTFARKLFLILNQYISNI